MHARQYTWGFLLRVCLKAALLFGVLNVAFAVLNPLPMMGRISVYHTLVTPRERLPYGENPAAYNLSLNNLPAMFASHALSARKPADEFRVLVLGDSSVWGVLLQPQHTLSGQINALGLTVDGRRVRAYNIGHPILSVTKDLMLLDEALRHQPDAIVWLVTLDALYTADQLRPPLLQQNAGRVRGLIDTYGLNLDAALLPPPPDFWASTLVGQRRPLADWLRLQTFGFSWQATGIDQLYPDYTPTANNLSARTAWQMLDAGVDENVDEDALRDVLALDVLNAGYRRVGQGIPLFIINEPVFIADGDNSDVRYNAWYPRWAYDAYRDILAQEASAQGWRYVDLWDAVPSAEFTDSPVHLSPDGSRILAQVIADLLQSESS